MDFVGGRIKGYCGPEELGAPDDLERVIVEFIGRATATIDLAMQELDNAAIAEALIRRRLDGCHVRVILNHDYLREEGKAARPRSAGSGIARLSADKTEHKINRDIFAALCRCGIEVRIDLNPDAIFHHKFCLTDYRLTRDGDPRSGGNPAVLSGSANFTVTDCHNNLNHVLVFEDAGVQAEFAIEFAEAWAGEFGRGRLGKPPKTVDVDGVPVKVLFSPDHGPEAEIVKQLLKCPKDGRIDCAMFTFAGTSAIDDAMIVMVEAGRDVRVVLDRGQSRPTATWPAARWLKRGGVDVRVPKRRRGLRKLHHKIAVIDGSTVVAGSYNYSEPATLFNDEALLVIGSTHSESEHVDVDRAACEQIATFFGDEIARIAADSVAWTETT
jgi:phosphatidylserine/phosphatidylglycerophosphate/cardiolipin synthase-like enzyme